MLVVEDVRILAEMLAAVLNLEDGIEVVAQVSDGDVDAVRIAAEAGWL